MDFSALLTAKHTITFILIVIAVIVVVDIYLAFGNKIPEDTISDVIQRWALQNMVVAWAWAVLAGHFFLPRAQALLGQPASVITLIIITLVLAGVGFPNLTRQYVNIYTQATLIALGAITGHLLWPQPLP